MGGLFVASDFYYPWDEERFCQEKSPGLLAKLRSNLLRDAKIPVKKWRAEPEPYLLGKVNRFLELTVPDFQKHRKSFLILSDNAMFLWTFLECFTVCYTLNTGRSPLLMTAQGAADNLSMRNRLEREEEDLIETQISETGYVLWPNVATASRYLSAAIDGLGLEMMRLTTTPGLTVFSQPIKKPPQKDPKELHEFINGRVPEWLASVVLRSRPFWLSYSDVKRKKLETL